MGRIRVLVLDVLKPHEPSILNLSSVLSDLDGVDGADIGVYEIDSKVENVKVTLKGTDIKFSEVKAVIEENGGTVHSIDKVSSGAVIVEEATTPQDNHHKTNA